jgi:Domain of unknown function DUF11
VSLVVELSPASPVVGDLVAVRITATNNGPGDAFGVTVRSEAPPGATEASGTTSKGSCTGTVELVCSLGTLSATPPGISTSRLSTFAAGETAHVEHRFRLSAGSATIRATAASSSSDPNPTDNQWSRSLELATEPAQDPIDDGKPNPNETVVVKELAGRILVKLPGTSRYVDLSALTLAEIPNGTLVDSRNGRFELTVAAPGDTTSSTVFSEGIAAIDQRAASTLRTPAQAAQPGVTELRLAGGDFGKPCTTALAKAKAKAKKKPKRRTFGVAQAKPVKPVRRLWGNGSGKFRTRGRYSTATVRGTVWLTEDYCNGTLVRVREGAVTVRDLVKNRTVVVTAGTSYFAEAPAPKAAKAKAKKARNKRTTAG